MDALRIGRHDISPALILAPMAGITDKPMRLLCRRFGAGYAVSEMLASDPRLRDTRKSRRRRGHSGEPGPVGVQIAGSDPLQLAEAARFNVAHGAEIIDINMGCPAKKVLKSWAGSALLEDEARVAKILDAVVASVDVPVTLKIRTGPSARRRNGVTIARIAEDAGIAALAVHGRTREQKFTGEAEFETIAAIKRAVTIPVIANGDIADAKKAADVLAATGVDGLMLGRAAQGRPWVFTQIVAALAGDSIPPAPESDALFAVISEHLEGLYTLYGETQGVRVARKHIAWYLQQCDGFAEVRQRINRVETPADQLGMLHDFLCCERADTAPPAAAGRIAGAATVAPGATTYASRGTRLGVAA